MPEDLPTPKQSVRHLERGQKKMQGAAKQLSKGKGDE